VAIDGDDKPQSAVAAADSRASWLMYFLVRAIAVGFCRLWFRVSYRGRQNIPVDGAFILAPVHRSNMDTLVVSGVTRRRMRFLAKDSLFKTKAGSWFIGSLGGIPVRRGTADREAMRLCSDVVDQGDGLVMFPEGTRQYGPVVQDLFDGASYVAARAGVPIVPVGIGGSERAMRKGSPMIWPVKIRVIVGAPIYPAPKVDGRVPRHAVKELSNQVKAELQRLLDEASRPAS
jgi:1-acyl-sn-glycerol-3-phosphate acyltransferase